jgi:hypothetical protein
MNTAPAHGARWRSSNCAPPIGASVCSARRKPKVLKLRHIGLDVTIFCD